MARQMRPADPSQLLRLAQGMDNLRMAMNDVRAAGCPQVMKRLALAMSSAKGAERHMHHRLARAQDPAKLES
jgi:hypothetical protein